MACGTAARPPDARSRRRSPPGDAPRGARTPRARSPRRARRSTCRGRPSPGHAAAPAPARGAVARAARAADPTRRRRRGLLQPLEAEQSQRLPEPLVRKVLRGRGIRRRGTQRAERHVGPWDEHHARTGGVLDAPRAERPDAGDGAEEQRLPGPEGPVIASRSPGLDRAVASGTSTRPFCSSRRRPSRPSAAPLVETTASELAANCRSVSFSISDRPLRRSTLARQRAIS